SPRKAVPNCCSALPFSDGIVEVSIIDDDILEEDRLDAWSCGASWSPPPPLPPWSPAAWITPKRPPVLSPGWLGPASKKSWLVLPLSGVPSPNSRSHRPLILIGVPFGWSSCPRYWCVFESETLMLPSPAPLPT